MKTFSRTIFIMQPNTWKYFPFSKIFSPENILHLKNILRSTKRSLSNVCGRNKRGSRFLVLWIMWERVGVYLWGLSFLKVLLCIFYNEISATRRCRQFAKPHNCVCLFNFVFLLSLNWVMGTICTAIRIYLNIY